MKCPLRSQSYKGAYGQDKYEVFDCLKEECAWWSEKFGRCDPTGLSPFVQGIAANLANLVNKMPHPPAPQH